MTFILVILSIHQLSIASLFAINLTMYGWAQQALPLPCILIIIVIIINVGGNAGNALHMNSLRHSIFYHRYVVYGEYTIYDITSCGKEVL